MTDENHFPGVAQCAVRRCPRMGCLEIVGGVKCPDWDQGQCGDCGEWFWPSSSLAAQPPAAPLPGAVATRGAIAQTFLDEDYQDKQLDSFDMADIMLRHWDVRWKGAQPPAAPSGRGCVSCPVIKAIDPFTRGAFTGWAEADGNSRITLDEAEDHFSLCMADMMDAAREAARPPAAPVEAATREAIAKAIYDVEPFYEGGEYVDGFQVSPGGALSWQQALARDAEFADDILLPVTKFAFDAADAVLSLSRSSAETGQLGNSAQHEGDKP